MGIAGTASEGADVTADGSLHLYEHELADYQDGLLNEGDVARITEHLSICPACRVILDQFADHPGPEVPTASSWTQTAILAPTIRAAFQEHRVAAPEAGQVWRLRGTQSGSGEELLELAVILRAGDELLVAPVTTDSREATDLWTLQTTLDGTPVSAWVSLQCPMGYEVLDVLLGQLDVEALLDVHRAFRRGEQPPRGWPLGRHLDDELRLHREDIRAAFIPLSEIRIDSAAVEELDGAGDETPSLASQLKKGGWDVVSLAQATGITAKQARGALSGTAGLSSEQQLAAGIVPGAAQAWPQLDPGWVAAVARPELRPRYEREARRRHEDPWSFREQCLREPIAARGNRGETAHWFELAEQQLQRLEAEELPDA